MKIKIDRILCQFYVIPFVKITYDKWLNGNYELIIGWLNREIIISIQVIP